jgi:16S rRNA (guanine527-N7)-methyltransferase
MRPNRRSLQELIERCGLSLSPPQYDQLWAYHGMLRAANPALNLTRIHNFENMVLKHYVDSLLVLGLVELPSPLLDLGSGPGLPGVPLKIARPDISMILAESRGARAEFLRDVVSRLGLTGIEIYSGKVGPRFDREIRGVITRAVGSIPATLDLVAECLEPGGRMIFMKGPECDTEIAAAKQSHTNLFRLDADRAYLIPGTAHQRRLVVYERHAGESAALPAEHRTARAGPVRTVTSESNPTFRLYRDLLTGRGIRKHGLAIVAGVRQVAEVLEGFPDRAEAWLSNLDGPGPSSESLLWVRLAAPLFQELDTSGTHAPMVTVRVPEMPEWSEIEPWPDGCTLFVPFQDPENVGAVIRSAAAFGVARVVLLRESAHPFHPRSVRAAGPALFHVPLCRGPTIHELRAVKQPLIALTTDGPDIARESFPDRFGLVPGLEGPGLPPQLREGARRCIPIAEGVESLNAAAAAAIALYVWSKGRR